MTHHDFYQIVFLNGGGSRARGYGVSPLVKKNLFSVDWLSKRVVFCKRTKREWNKLLADGVNETSDNIIKDKIDKYLVIVE